MNALDRYYDCEICGGYHRWEFDGDCRNDDERLAEVPEDEPAQICDEFRDYLKDKPGTGSAYPYDLNE